MLDGFKKMVKKYVWLGQSGSSRSTCKCRVLGRPVFFDYCRIREKVSLYSTDTFLTFKNVLTELFTLNTSRFIYVEEIDQPQLILGVGIVGLIVNLVGLCLFRRKLLHRLFECGLAYEIRLG